jgi:hypothetical protein
MHNRSTFCEAMHKAYMETLHLAGPL